MTILSGLVDLARTPDEIKEDMPALMPVSGSAPLYPYGLCLSLDDDSLEKLGIDEGLPDVGDVIQIAAVAKVTSVSSYQSEKRDGSKEECRRVELQITRMKVIGVEEEPEERQGRWYGATTQGSERVGEYHGGDAAPPGATE